jgi:hypothetical protein
MHDINRAERLLSLFTSPDSAAGIVGDLSEERGRRGSVWFWRQVLGTASSLLLGVLVATPGLVLLLVVLGLALNVAYSFGSQFLFEFLRSHGVSVRHYFPVYLILHLFGWLGAFLTGATVAWTAPRVGMVACMLLVGIHIALSVVLQVMYPSTSSPNWWISSIIFVQFVAPLALLLLGGALIRRRQNGRILRTAE